MTNEQNKNQKPKMQIAKDKARRDKVTKAPWQDQIINLLLPNPGLREKLVEALGTDHFFLSVTYQKKTPGGEHDLMHFWLRHRFNKNDVVSSLRHIASDFNAKENPTAELDDEKGWH